MYNIHILLGQGSCAKQLDKLRVGHLPIQEFYFVSELDTILWNANLPSFLKIQSSQVK